MEHVWPLPVSRLALEGDSVGDGTVVDDVVEASCSTMNAMQVGKWLGLCWARGRGVGWEGVGQLDCQGYVRLVSSNLYPASQLERGQDS